MMENAECAANDYHEFFARHLVGLAWYEGRVNAHGEFTRRPDYYCASGFILQVCDTFCLITAGHVITDYEERKMQGAVGKSHCLLDSWSPKATIKEPIFFDFTVAPALVEDCPKLGLDYAAIALPSFLLRALLLTIAPITNVRLAIPGDVDGDFYAILGSPSVDATQELGVEGVRNTVNTYSDARVILVDGCPEPPHDTQTTLFPQFIGTIHPSETVTDIVGTSGGPIFDFRTNSQGQLEYKPVAIQSRWRPRSRIVIGSLIPIVAKRIHDWIEQFGEGLGSAGDD